MKQRRLLATLGVASAIAFAIFGVGCAAKKPVVSKADLDLQTIERLGGESPIVWAEIRKRAVESAQIMANHYGVTCEPNGFFGAGECMHFLAEVVRSPELRELLEAAKTLGVSIKLGKTFDYGDGWVMIQAGPTQEVIDYLRDRNKKPK